MFGRAPVRRHVTKIFTACIVLLMMTACGGNIIDRDQNLEAFTAEQIFERGEFELQRGRIEDATWYFSEVERLYPYSALARRAVIMQAFAYHSGRDYESARSAAERFIEFFPADEDAAYAQYLLALSHYDQIDDIGRDQSLTLDALQELRIVIERFPESEYADSAKLKFDLAFDHLAGKEMEVGRYYLRRGHYNAAINRFRIIVEDFQTTLHTPEALHRLVEAYLSLGLADQATTAAAILGHNYRGTDWYADSYHLLTGLGQRPRVRGNNWLARVYRQSVKGEWL
ncbi:MAG: outer membrane protein assembly factor BamD [Aestuariivita sp.]|nr:outer membrane protein assembly factor BamD [Aestuariivita sp.]MCY4202418.1 outer membrane protein assembly factor BamD [Aestuariivita sp.]